MDPHSRIFVALDTTDMERAANLSTQLSGLVGGLKVGKEFFTAHGPQGVKKITGDGQPLFLDLKYHDIPNTVASAVRAALPLKPFMLNVHASGGSEMMKAAAEAVREAGEPRPLLLAVTVLTSLNDDDLAQTGVTVRALDQVIRLARLAESSGLDGVVCSPREVSALRQSCRPGFKLVVPGIRPDGANTGDQKRTATPLEALQAGADYLVIGRPITGVDDPAQAAKDIAAEMK